jgi:phosphoenolpyruvate phosphomutase
LAAGKGSRLGSLTKNIPKCLLKISSTTIIERLINQFKKRGIKKIVIVTGYKSKKIEEKFSNKYKLIKYNQFHNTNNFYTLWSVRKEIDEDTIIAFSDLVVEDFIIKKIFSSKCNFTTIIDSSHIRSGTMFVSHKNKILTGIGIKDKKKATGNFIGIAKIKKNSKKVFFDNMSQIMKKSKKDYYTKVFNLMVKKKYKINATDISGKYWREVDTKKDYNQLKKEI